jgi:hypothetical protein
MALTLRDAIKSCLAAVQGQDATGRAEHEPFSVVAPALRSWSAHLFDELCRVLNLFRCASSEPKLNDIFATLAKRGSAHSSSRSPRPGISDEIEMDFGSGPALQRDVNVGHVVCAPDLDVLAGGPARKLA